MKYKQNILEISDICKNYSESKRNFTEVIRHMSFGIEKGKYYSVMGKSGCGKTTLLKLLGGIERPSSGKIYFKNKEISTMDGNELADYKRCHIGFIYQDYRLLNNLTVEENIILPLTLDEKDMTISKKKVKEICTKMDIDHLMKRYPIDLSGGEKQRVAICRALINDPEIILADEPTGNLDSKSAAVIVSIFKEIHEEMKKTLIMVTHDPQMASYSEEVLLLKDGKVLDFLEKNDEKEFYNSIIIEMNKI